jgi:hypothetical protein
VKKLIFILFFIFYGYAVVRYHLGKEMIGWKAFFVVLNKAIAWLAGTLLMLSLLRQNFWNRFNLNRRTLGTTGYWFAIVHILSAIILLDSTFYPKFYDRGSIGYMGWNYIATGALSILFFSIPLYASVKNKPEASNLYHFGRYGILMNLVHVFMIGFKGWLEPTSWPLAMPPITLIFVTQIISVLIFRAITALKKKV